LSITNVTQFAGAVRSQLGLQVDAGADGSASPNNSAEFLSKTVSSLDLSGAEYGTVLLKDRLNDEGYAYAVVTFQEQQLSALYTHLENVKSVADQIAAADPNDTVTYAALVEELAEREDQLSRFIGAQFHANEINFSAGYVQNLEEDSHTEIVNIYDDPDTDTNPIGQMAAIEVDFKTLFASLHNPDTCAHCVALAQQTTDATLADDEQPSYALDQNDNSSGSVNDIDGTATIDTSDARLEPLRMSTQWNVTGDATLTYSFYVSDGVVAYASPYNGSSGTPGNPSSVTSHGATNEATLSAAFAAWDAATDFEFVLVDENTGAVGEFRVAFTDRTSGAAAFAYRPGDYAVNGDIWFETEDIDISGNDFSTDGVGAGGFNYFAALHEIGHALGLSHPFDSGDDSSNGDDDLPLAQDSMRNTVMTYVQLDRNFVLQLSSNGSSVSTSPSYRIYASTPMMYDIEMMEHYYGAEDDSSSNDTYSFAVSPETIQTITDSGGTDTIDASNQTRENIIDLNAGSFSSIGIYSIADQKTDLANAYGVSETWLQSYIDALDANASASNDYYSAYSRTALYTGEYNVGIASSAVIENAIGGVANDTITGNSSANMLNGGAGDDLIEGNGGDDTIDGGAGTEDVLVFNDVRANYTITDLGGGSYSIAHNGGAGADGTDTFSNIEFLQFTDQTIAWPADTTATLPASSGAQGASGSGSAYSGSGSSSSSSGTLAGVSVETLDDARSAITTLDSTLETLSTQLARMGAYRNRLEASITNLTRQSMSTEAAIGRIMDADFASEMAKLTKNKILSEAANQVLYGSYLTKQNLTKLLR